MTLRDRLPASGWTVAWTRMKAGARACAGDTLTESRFVAFNPTADVAIESSSSAIPRLIDAPLRALVWHAGSIGHSGS
jgi:hypothetical protein